MGRNRPAPIEAGAVETEQIDTSGAPAAAAPGTAEPGAPQQLPVMAAVEPAPRPTRAALTGPQMAEVRTRNETTDRLRERAKALSADANDAARAALYAQEALTDYVGRLIAFHDLDGDFRYRVDLESGQIVSVGRIAEG